MVHSIQSHREIGLASRHFLVTAQFDIEVPKDAIPKARHAKPFVDFDDDTFSHVFENALQCMHADNDQSLQGQSAVNDTWDKLQRAFNTFVSVCKVTHACAVHRPWISCDTLDLIEARDKSRWNCDYTKEKDLNRQVKQSAKRDRARYLDDIAAQGSWSAVKRIRTDDCKQKTKVDYETCKVQL